MEEIERLVTEKNHIENGDESKMITLSEAWDYQKSGARNKKTFLQSIAPV